VFLSGKRAKDRARVTAFLAVFVIRTDRRREKKEREKREGKKREK
jgi:hypothetical protein